jgi:hypothetical protein
MNLSALKIGFHRLSGRCRRIPARDGYWWFRILMQGDGVGGRLAAGGAVAPEMVTEGERRALGALNVTDSHTRSSTRKVLPAQLIN